MAVAPIQWLWQSWHQPAYQSDGMLYALVLVGLMAASALSGPAKPSAPPERIVALFLLAAALRCVGQMLDIDIVSALALSVDVYVIAALLRLDQRRFALSPFWLAVFFLFSLPLGTLLQRILGFPLQMVSADLACAMLSVVFDDLTCAGVRLQVSGRDVLVDLPCSGATGLLLIISLCALLNALYRPRFTTAILGGFGALLAALIGNGLRITLLATGIALDFDVMAEPAHSIIGLVALGLAASALLVLYRPRTAPVRRRPLRVLPQLPAWAKVPSVLAALILAAAIVTAPRTPIDRAAPYTPPPLPTQLVGHTGQDVALSDMERLYFTTYGGSAQKAQYGPLGVNVVTTTSMRHLHSPATCLQGMGYEVEFLGTRFDPVPTSVYRATGPDGLIWDVSVSFASENGHRTASVGEAVWLWFRGGTGRWRSIQRITPAQLPPNARAPLENAVMAAFDL